MENKLWPKPNQCTCTYLTVLVTHTHIAKTIKSLKCWSTNADSLFNKLDELKTRIYLFSPDIIAITEIYPKHSQYELTAMELSIHGYDIFYNDN